MAVRAGQILFDVGGFVIDRIQTGGVNSLNIRQERISEVGDFYTVGIVRDTPDLSFEVQSLDVSTDIESLLCNSTPTAIGAPQDGGATPSGNQLSFLNTQPVDITSPFRAANGQFNIVQGVVVPFLNLERAQYRFGLRANAEETFTLRGDAIYYVPGVPVHETAAGGSTTYTFQYGPAVVYHELGQTVYALSVWWYDPVSGLTQRLFHTQDYTDSTTGFTLNNPAAVPGSAVIHYTYGAVTPNAGSLPTPTAPFYYPQSANKPQSVKPAAIRSKDMDVYIGVNGTMLRLSGTQSFNATWSVQLQQFEEFGNAHYVSNDFNFATVEGSVGLKGVNPYDMIRKIQSLTGVPPTEIAGALTYPQVQLEARLRNPDTHQIIKTLYIPDAQFEAPPMSVRANQQAEMTLNFSSARGDLQVFDGERQAGDI